MEGKVADEQEERQVFLSCKCLMRSERSLVLDLDTCIWGSGMREEFGVGAVVFCLCR